MSSETVASQSNPRNYRTEAHGHGVIDYELLLNYSILEGETLSICLSEIMRGDSLGLFFSEHTHRALKL